MVFSEYSNFFSREFVNLTLSFHFNDSYFLIKQFFQKSASILLWRILFYTCVLIFRFLYILRMLKLFFVALGARAIAVACFPALPPFFALRFFELPRVGVLLPSRFGPLWERIRGKRNRNSFQDYFLWKSVPGRKILILSRKLESCSGSLDFLQ